MGYYGIAFFYGIKLEEGDFIKLLRSTEKFAPPPGLELESDIEHYYDTILYELKTDGLESSVKELVADPLKIEHVRPRKAHLRFSYYCLGIGETFHFLPSCEEPHSFDLRPVPNWDSQLKAVCTKYGLSWKNPQFYLCVDYPPDENWVVACIHGAFFYGLEVATFRDSWAVLQKIIECDGEVFFIKDEHGDEKYNPFWVMYYYKLLNKTSVQRFPLWSARWDDSDFEPEGTSHAPLTATPQEAVFHSLDAYELEELISDLDDLWKNRGEAVCIGSIKNGEHGSIYLAIRSTHHTVSDSGNVEPFSLPESSKVEWDRLLHEKCTKYGFPLNPSSYHLLTDDS